jgi:hypothetical protein
LSSTISFVVPLSKPLRVAAQRTLHSLLKHIRFLSLLTTLDMFASLIALAVLASPALASLSMTAPVASTSWQGGAQQTINWIDDGKTPNLQAFGPSTVGLFVGNAIQQTQLQLIVDSVDVSTTSSISFTPDPSVGANANIYFIRFTSLGLKDATNPNYPAEAFSAKFTLSAMTGTFNATVQAQIDAASSAPVGGATSAPPAAGAPSAPTTSGGAAPTSPAAGSSPASGSSKPSSPTSSHSSAAPSGSAAAKAANGASGVAASVGFVGTVVALASAMLF